MRPECRVCVSLSGFPSENSPAFLLVFDGTLVIHHHQPNKTHTHFGCSACHTHTLIITLTYVHVLHTQCDSVADTTQAACSAAAMLWPDDMQAAKMLDPRDAGVRKSWVGGDWSEYSDDRRLSSEIPRWLEEV